MSERRVSKTVRLFDYRSRRSRGSDRAEEEA